MVEASAASADTGEVSAKENVAVFGLGYVGCVSAACLARLGHQVIGVDLSESKIQAVNEGYSPFYEPGLGAIVSEATAAKRLRATNNTAEAVAASDIAMICVGTPSAKNGNQSVDQIERVCSQIAQAAQGRDRPLLVVIRSTVFPGTCEGLVQSAFEGNTNVVVLSHPEFLREGTAIRDFEQPSLLVVGGAEPHRSRVAALYADLPGTPSLVELRTAELIKFSCNAFHALKIAFANEIGALADAQGIPADEVMATLCEDKVLNVSAAYLKPGFAFGGSCLPKDLRAIVYRGRRLDLDLPLLSNVLPANEAQLERATSRLLDLPPDRKFALFGLTFKEDTDDLRESPTVALLETLIGKGRHVRVYDPNIALDKIYGANKEFLMERVPHIGRLLDDQLEDTLAWADQLVLAQKPKGDYVEQLRASNLPVINLIGGDPLG